MVRFNRRQQKAADAPIFSDVHSMSGAEGESTGDNGSSRGFSARIIVTEGSNPCNILEPSQEAALDTTLGLEDGSYCSSEGERGNELVIITSAVLESEDSVLEPDSEDDEEAAIEIEEATSVVSKASLDSACNRVKVFKAILVILVLAAIAIPASIILTGDDANKEIASEKSLSDGDDLGLPVTAAPSSEGSFVEAMIPLSDTDSNMTVVSPQVLSSSPSSTPEEMATLDSTSAPTPDPTPVPTPDPSPAPTPFPSPSPTKRPTRSPTLPPSEKPTSLAPTPWETNWGTPRPTSPQFSVSIFQTAIVTPAPTSEPTTDTGTDKTFPPTSLVSVVNQGSNETNRW